MKTTAINAAFESNTAAGWTPATYRVRKTPAARFALERLTAMTDGAPEWTLLVMHKTEQAARNHATRDAAEYGRSPTFR